MRNLLSVAALGAALLSGGAALAQPAPPQRGANHPAPPPGGPGRKMMRADANRDGVITKAEMRAMATRKFDRMDANHDGKLDATEMQAHGRRGGGRGPRRGPNNAPPPPSDDGE